MFTNTYAPLVGGIEKSIATFTEDFRKLGHRTLVVTPAFEGAEESDEHTLRLPSLKNIQGSQFSWPLPMSSELHERLDDFAPDIIHAHQPFLMGDTALREARRRQCPLVFTNHTLYERYVDLFDIDSEAINRLARTLPVEFANLCDLVIAPTISIAGMIRQRGVEKPVEVAPTGISTDFFADGDGKAFRHYHGLPQNAFVLGHLGRLVSAKNMLFLAKAVAQFLRRKPEAWFLLVGEGDETAEIEKIFQEYGVIDRVVHVGQLVGTAVADAYAAMDLFVFASMTDTQGIVLIESFSAGVPIIALNAPGARDIIRNAQDGRLLDDDCGPADFAEALIHAHDHPETRSEWSRNALYRAQEFDRTKCATRLLGIYENLLNIWRNTHNDEFTTWDKLQESFLTEWHLLEEKAAIAAAAFFAINVHRTEKKSVEPVE